MGIAGDCNGESVGITITMDSSYGGLLGIAMDSSYAIESDGESLGIAMDSSYAMESDGELLGIAMERVWG